MKNSISNSPDNFLLDFEVSVFKSIREVYGNVGISGCTFHLFQNLRKQARKKGCGGLFDTNEDAKTLLKMIKSLCYCPPAYIVDIFDSIIDPFITEKGLDESSELCKFMKYFEDTYVGGQARRGRKPPMFAHETWNIFHTLQANKPSTNNSIEQLNREWNFNQKGKQTVYTAIKGFRREVLFSDVKHSELLNGTYIEPNPGRKKKLATNRKRKCELMSSFQYDKCDEFVQKIIKLI